MFIMQASYPGHLRKAFLALEGVIFTVYICREYSSAEVHHKHNQMLIFQTSLKNHRNNKHVQAMFSTSVLWKHLCNVLCCVACELFFFPKCCACVVKLIMIISEFDCVFSICMCLRKCVELSMLTVHMHHETPRPY